MTTELTTAEKIRKLPWLVANALTNNIFCYFTLFGPVFVLFLDALKLDKSRIGFLIALMPFCQIVSLFMAPLVMRMGLKRTFLTFFGIRYGVAGFLLMTPLMVMHVGLGGAFLFVAGIILVFAICRAIGETAFYSWEQEIVPNAIRGKFGAVNSTVSTIGGVLALAVASYVVGRSEELSRFMILIGAGTVFGFISIVSASFIPGGSSESSIAGASSPFAHVTIPLKDRNFIRYICGLALVCMTTTSLASFIPLFMKESVRVGSGNVILLTTASLVAALFSGYLWGWAADRFGSKPVMLSGLCGLVLLPACWFLIPRGTPWSLIGGIGIYFFWGVASYGYGTGDRRLLYVSIVPPEKKTPYMSVYYAVAGLAGGLGPLLSGKFLDMCAGIEGRFSIFTFDQYSLFFGISLVLLVAGMMILRNVREEKAMPAREFMGMFLRGNPLQAFTSLVGYSLARGESARVSMTERLGDAKSPLNVDELLDALNDPSFNVRYEAVISIARTKPNKRLTRALIRVLEGGEMDLRTGAAWALGRSGDTRAIEPLRGALESEYPLLQARSARALAMLGDTESIPVLLKRFRTVRDKDLRLAFGAALGTLRSREAAGELMSVLRNLDTPSARSELTLAIACIVGVEGSFIRLWKQMSAGKGTAISRSVASLRRKIRRAYPGERKLFDAAAECQEAFAQDDMDGGAGLLREIIGALSLERYDDLSTAVLNECVERLREFGGRRIEYIVLALQMIDSTIGKRRKR
jgi:hypothetical protein